MDETNKEYELNLESYVSHGEVGAYYSEYLLEILSRITEENIIKSLQIENHEAQISVKLETVVYLSNIKDVNYAFYIYNSKYKGRFDFIRYSKPNRMTYEVTEAGEYRVKVFVKTGEQKITEYTDYIQIDI